MRGDRGARKWEIDEGSRGRSGSGGRGGGMRSGGSGAGVGELGVCGDRTSILIVKRCSRAVSAVEEGTTPTMSLTMWSEVHSAGPYGGECSGYEEYGQGDLNDKLVCLLRNINFE